VPLDYFRIPTIGQRAPRAGEKRTPGAWRALAGGFGHRLDCVCLGFVAKAMALANNDDKSGGLGTAERCPLT